MCFSLNIQFENLLEISLMTNWNCSELCAEVLIFENSAGNTFIDFTLVSVYTIILMGHDKCGPGWRNGSAADL